jgi:hypothetical protein
MTVWLNFAGWFQCRLATDPDPCDEPRGVSGYAQALAGEPDLDRVIRLQPEGATIRPFCPDIGVAVRSVVVDGSPHADHPLVGAAVDLHGPARFEGRNGIVADDGFEPIVPFDLRLSKGAFQLQRRHAADDQFPFRELQPTGIQPGLTDIADATGIEDLWTVWQVRKKQVDDARRDSHDEVEKAALRKRSAALNSKDLASFFTARMLYSIKLKGPAVTSDPDAWLPVPIRDEDPWLVDFWLGGWDPDALSGFMKGTLRVEAGPDTEAVSGPPAETTAAVPSPVVVDQDPRSPRRP